MPPQLFNLLPHIVLLLASEGPGHTSESVYRTKSTCYSCILSWTQGSVRVGVFFRYFNPSALSWWFTVCYQVPHYLYYCCTINTALLLFAAVGVEICLECHEWNTKHDDKFVPAIKPSRRHLFSFVSTVTVVIQVILVSIKTKKKPIENTESMLPPQKVPPLQQWY